MLLVVLNRPEADPIPSL